jgi:PAS domain S-box-containing protein
MPESERFGRRLRPDRTFELAGSALAIIMKNGKLCAVNPQFCSLFVSSKRTLLATTLPQLISQPDLLYRESIQSLLRGEVKCTSLEVTCNVRTDDPTPIKFHFSLYPRCGPRSPLKLLVTAEDLTLVRKTQAKLEFAESELAKVEELGKLGRWTYDPSTDAIAWSETLARATGWEPDLPAPVFKEHNRFYTPESWKLLTDAVKRALQVGAPFHLELEAIRMTDEPAWVIVRGEPKRDEAGRITSLSGTVQDITERKEEERSLRESEEKFAKAFRCSPQPFTLSTIVEDRYLDVNDAFELTTGYTREEALGRTTEEMGIWEDRPEREKLVQKALRGERIRNVECRFRKKNGEIFIGLLSAELIDQIAGIPCVVANTIDITEWRRTEDALHAAEKRAALYLRQTMFGVIELDRERRIVEWNPAAEVIFGFSRSEALGRRPDQLIISEAITAAVQQVLDAVVVEHSGKLFVNENIRKDGRKITCEWFNTPLIGPKGEVIGVVALAHDITARTNAERAMMELSGRLLTAQEEERKRLARELHDALGQQVALVAVGLSSLAALTEPTAVSSQIRHLRHQMQKIATEVSNLSHQLHPSALQYLGINAALHSLCREISAAHGLDISLECKELPRHLVSDAELCVYRIVQEALRNVLKHSEASQARISLAPDSNGICLLIVDDGIGFDVSKYSGGLGLVSMRERLRAVNGSLQITSKPGDTRIEVRIPMSDIA